MKGNKIKWYTNVSIILPTLCAELHDMLTYRETRTWWQELRMLSSWRNSPALGSWVQRARKQTNKNSPSRRSVQVKKAWKITWQVIQKSVEPPDQGSFLHSQIRYPKLDIRQSWMGNQKSRGKNTANTQWKQHPSSRPQGKSRRRNGSRRRLCLTWSQHFELLK